MKKILSFFLISIAVFFISSLPVQAVEVIKIGGTGGALETMKIIGKAFEKKNPGFKVDVLYGMGTLGILKAVPEGAVDIGIYSGTLTDEQSSKGLIAIEYARTPFVFVTGKDINQNNITTKDIVMIYNREKELWPGGERIRWILHPVGDPDTLVVESLSPEVRVAIGSALKQRGIVLAHTDQENLDIVEKTHGAFGYAPLTQIISEKRNVKILSLNGISPSARALADKSYPIFRTYYILMKKQNTDKLRKLIDFIMSDEGARILKANGNLVIKRK